jgi:hypothetical protein
MKQGDNHNDYKIERHSCGKFTMTELATGKKTEIKADGFDFEYGSLLRFNQNGQRQLVQFEDRREEVNYHFSIKGN